MTTSHPSTTVQCTPVSTPTMQLGSSPSPSPSSRSGSVSPSLSDSSGETLYSRKAYRLASSFELGDEQPVVTSKHRARILQPTSYQNLFGPVGGVVGRSRPRYRREGTRPDRDQPVRRMKTLPVNTLTGAVMGGTCQIETPVYAQVIARRSPGGNHSQLW